MPNYRVLVHYDPDKSVFVARAPELEHCRAEGATRQEAMAKIEEEMTAQLEVMRERGGSPPVAVDDPGAEFTGEISAKVSNQLHRELVFQAKAEGVEVGQLFSEILPVALELRRRERRRPIREEGPSDRPERGDRPDRGDRDRRGGRGGTGGRYHAIMEDKATFLEYVRGLDSGGGAPRPPRGPRRGRGPGSTPGSGSDED